MKKIILVAVISALAALATLAADMPSEKPAFYPVLAEGLFLGGTQAGAWVASEKSANLVRSGTVYRLFNLEGRIGAPVAGGPLGEEDGAGCRRIEVGNDGLNWVGVAGDWDPQPRRVTALDVKDPKYVAFVQRFLDRKLKGARARIFQAVSVDQDGRGEKVFLAASSYPDGPPVDGQPGGYSLVIPFSQPARALEFDSFVRNAPPNLSRILAFADLNGDGTMEMVVSNRYYEGESFTVYDAGLKAVLTTGCGL